MITLLIVAVTVITSIRGFNHQEVINEMIFAPAYMRRNQQWHRFFSHGLIHADWMHLIFNMIALYSFGSMVEDTFVGIYGVMGRIIYVAMYIIALPASSLYDYIKYKNNSSYLALGASGAVSAVIFCSVLISPLGEIYMYLIPIPIPAYIFGPIYLLISFSLARNGGGRIAHDAHFWGAMFGLLFTTIAIPHIWPYFFSQIGLA